MRRRNRGRDISGVLVVDKEQGCTSNDVVQRAKRLFNARKVGHTGSLDPLATGVLPLCFGEATKFSQFLLSSDKVYRARILLGVRTASGDAEGEVLEERPVPELTASDIDAALEGFRGEIEQIPSMYSALKHNGQPLYKLARQGKEVEREPRKVHIFSNELESFDGTSMVLRIHCSKGTYVRSLAEDLGEQLGCGGHVTELRRLQAGPFGVDDMVTFDQLEAAKGEGDVAVLLQPISSAVRQWPVVVLPSNAAFYLRQGQPVQIAHAPTEGWVQLCEQSEAGPFMGVGEILDDGRVAPRRLVAG
ncbi:MAG: tRNA pseudouridine(55) synthase TruB [Pseudomonadota bacterium]